MNWISMLNLLGFTHDFESSPLLCASKLRYISTNWFVKQVYLVYIYSNGVKLYSVIPK